jgi:DNA (cytosine-5)-methyltransferase 1
MERSIRTLADHHFGERVTNFGDFTQIREDDVGPVDGLVGGTPCQAFSVAGKRLGLDDPRGNLTLEFLALARRIRANWLAWENVPGFLSHDGGRTMGTFLGLLGELGYGWAYRVLDAQYIRVDGLARAVPQRRKRLIVVGYIGDPARAAAVLFERESLRGDPAPRRRAIEDIAGTIGSSASRSRGAGTDPAGIVAHALRAEGFDASEDGTGRGAPLVPVCVHADAVGRSGEALTPSIDATGISRLRDPGMGISEGSAFGLTTGQPHAVAYSIMPQNSGKDYKAREVDVAEPLMAVGPVGGNQGGDFVAQPMVLMERGRDGSPNLEYRQDGTANAILTPNGGRGGLGVGAVAYPITPNGGAYETGGITGSLVTGTDNSAISVVQDWAVRRLTPRECERLMGLEDDFTLIPYRGKPAADGPRYKALGNSQTRNMMRWIAHGIADVSRAALARSLAA